MIVLQSRDKENRPVLVVRLEPGNLELLKQRKPIELKLKDYFPGGLPWGLRILIDFTDTPVGDAKVLEKQADRVLDTRTPKVEKQKPHCPECKSTVEQLGVWTNESPVVILFCASCGCVWGTGRKEEVVKVDPVPST